MLISNYPQNCAFFKFNFPVIFSVLKELHHDPLAKTFRNWLIGLCIGRSLCSTSDKNFQTGDNSLHNPVLHLAKRWVWTWQIWLAGPEVKNDGRERMDHSLAALSKTSRLVILLWKSISKPDENKCDRMSVGHVLSVIKAIYKGKISFISGLNPL